MSLAEKLAHKSTELEQNERIEKEKQQTEVLEPVRAHIKELEEEKRQIELIRNSLKLKSEKDVGIGKGMEEYKADIGKETENESSRLDSLIVQHREVLEKEGIKNKEDLIENPEFAEEAEVVSYKKAQEQNEEVRAADTFLIERLKKFGVNIESENLSYEQMAEAIAERLNLVGDKLLQEKLKTPEGKIEVTEKLAKNFEKNIPRLSFSKSQENNLSTLSIYARDGKTNLVFNGEKVRFMEYWANAVLSPNEEIKNAESIYGKEIVRDALIKAYQNMIHETILSFDKENENVLSLKEQMVSISPEEAHVTRTLKKDFESAQNEFRSVIKQKSEDLKKKEINFDPTYASGYGGKYERYISLAKYSSDSDGINWTLEHNDIFPPSYDFKKLQYYLENRTASVKEFTEAIKKIETEEDVNAFCYPLNRDFKGTAIQNVYQNLLSLKPEDSRFKIQDLNL